MRRSLNSICRIPIQQYNKPYQMLATPGGGDRDDERWLFAKFSHMDQWVSKKDVDPAAKAAANFAHNNKSNKPTISATTKPTISATTKKPWPANRRLNPHTGYLQQLFEIKYRFLVRGCEWFGFPRWDKRSPSDDYLDTDAYFCIAGSLNIVHFIRIR